MIRILKLVLLAVAATCAPSTIIPLTAPLTQSYFYIAPPQAQFQYQPLLKIQQQATPSTRINKIDAPKGQYFFFYPSAPQIPLLALRQDETGGYWEQLSNWWNGVTQGLGQNPSPPEVPSVVSGGSPEVPSVVSGGSPEVPSLVGGHAPVSGSTKVENFAMKQYSETMQPLMPASTMNMNQQRFYVINSLPQFYGNFAPIPTISNPILAIEPLRARSGADSIPAENEKNDQSNPQDVVVELAQQPAAVQSIQQLQLRSNFVEPLQRLDVNQPKIPVADNNEPIPEVAAQELTKFLEQARSQVADPNPQNTLNENEADKLRTEEKPLEEETSIAQSKPSGIAISGRGGVSSSAATATSVVGEGGLAVASPSSISVSGDFEDEEMKIKKTE